MNKAVQGTSGLALPSLGVDMETISRFDKYTSIEQARKLGCFTEGELAYSFSQYRPSQHLAVRFCAKEAVYKAFCSKGTELKQEIRFIDIEVISGENKVPKIQLRDERLLDYYVELSLSHCEDKAIAIAMVFSGMRQDK